MTKKSKWAFTVDKSADGIIDFFLKHESGIFNNLVEIVVFAASIGFNEKRFEETKKKGREAAWSIAPIGENKDKAILIAYLHTKRDRKILNDRAECWKILTGYANGGFDVLKEWKDESQTDEWFLKAIRTKMTSEII